MKILVIQQKMIGDVLTSSILFEALREKFPQGQLHFLVQRNTTPVLEGNAYIDQIIYNRENDLGKYLNYVQFVEFIRKQEYDTVIDAYSKIGSAVITFFSGAELRVGHYKWYTKFFYTHTKKYEDTDNDSSGVAIQFRLGLLRFLGIEPNKDLKPKIILNSAEIENARIFMQGFGIDLQQPIIMCSVLGSSEKKTYPLPYFAKLLEVVVDTTPAQLLFNYIPSQKNKVNKLLALCSKTVKERVIVECYAKNLRQFIAITSQCDLLIGNEGGAVNMAKALGLPTFAIFSPQITKKSWGPGDSEKDEAVHLMDYKPALFEKLVRKKDVLDANKALYANFIPHLFEGKLRKFLLKKKDFQRTNYITEVVKTPRATAPAIQNSPLREKLTAIIPVFNEAHNIENTLQSVAFADEIMVVDSYSTDGTVDLARKHTGFILQREFDYPASQKNWAIPQATHEWILLLDADERVTPALETEILEILKNPDPTINAYWIYRKNHFMGEEVHYSGWQNDKVIRLFKKSHNRYEDKMVHEEIIADGKAGFLKNRLYHNTYVDLDHYLNKLNKYAYWQAIDYDTQTGRLTPFHFLLKPLYKFFKHYIIQQGFRDGTVGFSISFLQSYSVVMRYIKLWLYRRNIK